jgi:hypothetical protein
VRRNLLAGLEVRGLTAAVGDDRGRQVIVAPAVFYYVKNTDGELKRLAGKYARDIPAEAAEWGLSQM